MMLRRARRVLAAALVVTVVAGCRDRAQTPLTPVQTTALRVCEPIFLASPAEVDPAVARVRYFHSRNYQLKPAIIAALKQAAQAAFTAVPLIEAIRAGPLTPVDEPPAAQAAEARLRLAQLQDKHPPATPDRPDQPAVVALAAALPDTRLRGDRGVTTHRAASILAIMVLPLPASYAREMIVNTPKWIPNVVETTRSRALEDRYIYPGMIAARDAAIAANTAALDTLSPQDVAALNAFYSSPAGRRYVNELVAVYARANDAAAGKMFLAYFPKAFALASR